MYILLCMSFGLTNQVINYFEYCLCKTYFMFEILKGEWLKILILGKLSLKLVFWKSISSHIHAFLFLIFNALRSVFKIRLFFLKRCFSRFSIDPNCFSINRISWIRFFKNGSWLFQKFSLSLSLSLFDLNLAPPQIFVVFYHSFFKVSLSKYW